jgi:hypothetical protein
MASVGRCRGAKGRQEHHEVVPGQPSSSRISPAVTRRRWRTCGASPAAAASTAPAIKLCDHRQAYIANADRLGHACAGAGNAPQRNNSTARCYSCQPSEQPARSNCSCQLNHGIGAGQESALSLALRRTFRAEAASGASPKKLAVQQVADGGLGPIGHPPSPHDR